MRTDRSNLLVVATSWGNNLIVISSKMTHEANAINNLEDQLIIFKTNNIIKAERNTIICRANN